jgi:hypothetical protein
MRSPMKEKKAVTSATITKSDARHLNKNGDPDVPRPTVSSFR